MSTCISSYVKIKYEFVFLSPFSEKNKKFAPLPSSAIDVYIKPKHDCTTIPFTYLLIFIYYFLFKRRTATKDNTKNQVKVCLIAFFVLVATICVTQAVAIQDMDGDGI
jgi:hypothetical protein